MPNFLKEGFWMVAIEKGLGDRSGRWRVNSGSMSLAEAQDTVFPCDTKAEIETSITWDMIECPVPPRQVHCDER